MLRPSSLERIYLSIVIESGVEEFVLPAMSLIALKSARMERVDGVCGARMARAVLLILRDVNRPFKFGLSAKRGRREIMIRVESLTAR